MTRQFDDNTSVWLSGAPADTPAPPLARDLTVDVAIIGGGFTGVSTAYHLSKRNPKLGIALLEATLVRIEPESPEQVVMLRFPSHLFGVLAYPEF